MMTKPMPTHIYIAGFTDGIVKIGRTSKPATRFYQHNLAALKRGATLNNKWVQPHENTVMAESILRFYGRLKFDQAWGTEYFRADFDTFLAYMDNGWDWWDESDIPSPAFSEAVSA